MKQLGNLAIVCAKRPEVLMTLYGGRVAVHIGAGPNRAVMDCPWDNDAEVSSIIHELNHGRYSANGAAAKAA